MLDQSKQNNSQVTAQNLQNTRHRRKWSYRTRYTRTTRRNLRQHKVELKWNITCRNRASKQTNNNKHTSNLRRPNLDMAKSGRNIKNQDRLHTHPNHRNRKHNKQQRRDEMASNSKTRIGNRSPTSGAAGTYRYAALSNEKQQNRPRQRPNKPTSTQQSVERLRATANRPNAQDSTRTRRGTRSESTQIPNMCQRSYGQQKSNQFHLNSQNTPDRRS